MWFKYKFKPETTEAQKKEFYQVGEKLYKYLKQGGFRRELMTNTLLRTDDGCEWRAVFPDAKAHEKYVEICMKWPHLNEFMVTMNYRDEVDGFICGLEDEIAKAPGIAQWHPDTKRIFKEPEVRYEPQFVGYKNLGDGKNLTKRGAPIVFEMEFEFTSEEAGQKAIELCNKSLKVMREKNELGPEWTSVKFWKVNNGKGYKCISICRAPKFYDKHIEMIRNHEMFAELMTFKDLVKEVSNRAYGLCADLNATKYLGEYYPNTERIHGTPVVEAWGPNYFGWAEDQ